MKKSPSSQSFHCSQAQQQSKPTNQQLNFIQKAYQLVNNPNNCQIIHWNRSGHTFIIQNIDRFEKQLLPLYFRHNRYQSFVRQLNMYDFHKIRNGDYYCQNKSQFRHQEFTRGNLQSIMAIRRKGFQAKNKQKQNTKIKKSYKINQKKTIRRKKLSQTKSTPNKNLLPSFMQQQQNSFFNELNLNNPNNNPNSNSTSNYNTDTNRQKLQMQNQQYKNKKQQKIQKLMEHILQHINNNENNNGNENNLINLQKKNRINQIISLAQLIKQKWLEINDNNCQNQDIKIMKDVYYRIKQQLNIQVQQKSYNQIQLNKTKSQQKQKQKDRSQNQQFQLLHTISQQQAIIDSIFRTQLRSTLICINTQTYLNYGYPYRKIDTLIGM